MSTYHEGVFDEDRWPTDRLLPVAIRSKAPQLRRGRLLVVAAIVLAAAAAFFASTSYQSTGSFSGASPILLMATIASLLNIPLLWRMGLRSTSTVLCVEHVSLVLLVAFHGSGAIDASLWWLAPAPLVATVLLGSRAGMASAVACSVGTLALFVAEAMGVVFLEPADDAQLFEMMAAISVFLTIAGLAYTNERSRERAESRVEDAVERLQQANEKLSQVAAALTTARDQALADANRKNLFLDDMRTFSQTQTEALQGASGSTEHLATTIRAIARSADVLATAARGSSRSIDGLAGASAKVQQTTTVLSAAVDGVAGELGALRSAVSSVQNGHQGLKSQATQTDRAMAAMEESSRAVLEASIRTASLSSEVIGDAERGAQAVARSRHGVDTIRQTAHDLRVAMAELVERTEAVDRIMAVIDEVAAETNVLALNASIIAAQAGEHGRGFSIVADQIKGLAARVAASTRQSAVVIDDVKSRARDAGRALLVAVDAVDAGGALTDDAALALDQILRSAREATQMARSIEGRTTEQVGQTSAVRAAMQRVLSEVEAASRATTAHATAANRIAEAVERLKLMAPGLTQQATSQVADAADVRAVMVRLAAMAAELNDVQRQQAAASEQVFASVEKLHRAQQGVDKAMTSLGQAERHGAG